MSTSTSIYDYRTYQVTPNYVNSAVITVFPPTWVVSYGGTSDSVYVCRASGIIREIGDTDVQICGR